MKRYLIILFAAVVAFACEEEQFLPDKQDGKIVVDPTSLTFEKTSSTQMLKVKSPKSWVLTQTENTDWCMPGIISGSGQSNFKVSVKKNTGAERTTTLTFTAEGLDPVSITVLQKGSDSVEEDVIPEITSGIAVEPQKPNADQPCTIVFKPEAGNPLYGYAGELFGHFGVVVDGEWKFVPSEWGVADEKVHFTKVADNHWEFKMEPSIREYFQSGDTPVVKIAIIVRTEDGSIKSHDNDQFCSVQDDKYKFTPFNPDPVIKEAMPSGLKHGINIHEDNSVTFVLYAQDKNNEMHDYCYLVGDWNNWERNAESSMKQDKASGCWWLKVEGFDPDKEYRYQFRLGNMPSSDICVSNPYTQVVYDQWNDKYLDGVPEFPEGAKALISAFQINKPTYSWQVQDFSVEDKRDLIIYELLFRDYSTTKDIAGAIANFDHIKNLGVNAIELMPIQEFDGNNSWGYNPNHYFALDKAYGTREQYKQFIDLCHQNGIAVIVDVVYNHSFGSHTWAKMWWDSANNATTENNPWYNAVARHPYNVGHDYNHENTMVKEQVKQSLEFLLTEYKVDGFRFDLTKGFTQKNTGNDVTAWGRKDDSRIAILKDYADHIWSVKDDAVVIFEHLSDWDEEEILANHGIQLWRNVNHDYRSAVTGGTGNFSNMYSTSPFGGYVGYMESHDEERLCFGAGVDASDVSWGVCGTLTSWGSTPDIKMNPDGVFFSAKNVTFKADDMFKIRGNNDWNDAFNYGALSKGYKLPLNKEYKLTLGAGSQDMAVPAAGTYDIYFSLAAEKVWLMEPGKRPENPSAVPGGGSSEDPFEVAMRRAGASAAFFLTVPGPKMIWQFGEIGYDLSINYPSGTDNDRTSEKPVKTEEYMAVPARKALYDTYAGLIRFRRDNPRFFDSDASFKWTPTGEVKTITCSVDGKTFYVVANFAKSNMTHTVPAGTWKDYFNDGASVSGSVTLKQGEFKLLTSF